MGRRRRASAPPGAGPSRAPELAGHEILGPAGFGAGGAVWAARDGAGHDVVVSVLSLPRGEAGAAELRRLAALRQGTHPHLARIRQVVSLDAGRCAVVSDRVRGPTLATVLAARGALDPAEVAGLLAGVGSALGHLHERGVVHGDVSPANVVVADDGIPVLVDLAGHGAHELGTPGFVPPERERGGAAGAPGDVWALARLVLWAAGDVPDARPARLLGEALDADPARRPTARDLASRAPEVAVARPVAVPPAAVLAQARMRDDVAPTRRRPETRRRARAATAPGTGRLPRRQNGVRDVAERPQGTAQRTTPRHVSRHELPRPWLGVAVSVGAAAVLTGLIVWSGPGERAGGFGHRPAAAQETDVGDVLAELLARRDGALVAQDAAALAATTVPGGSAAREDVVLLDRLDAAETTLEHLRTEVVEVAAVAPLDEGTAVDAMLLQHPHDRVVDGERVTVPAQEPRCARVVLVPGAAGTWHILRSEPCP